MFHKLNFSGRVRFEVPKTISYNFYFIFEAFGTIVWYVLNDPRMHLLQTVREISRLPSEYHQKLSKLIHAKDIFFFILSCQLLMLLLNSSEIAIDTLFEPLRIYIAMIVFQMRICYI